LIEDDIYGDLYFGKQRPKVCKAFDRRGLVLLCSSFSKVLSPAYRVGWISPGRFYKEIVRLKFTTTYTTATVTQMAIAEIIRNGGYEHHLRKLRKAYYNQVQNVIQAIAKYFPEGTRVTRPQGGFVLWVELAGTVDAMQLYRRALEEKISIVPGPIFSAKQQYKNFIRLNCSHVWSERFEQALFILGRLARLNH
jgi:DNA-binding transcriptional MocR family regulator